MEDKTAEKKIYSSGYAGTIPGVHKEINEDFVIFFEKEPEGTVGASNLYVLTDGVTGTFHPEITARFAGKKILYEYFKSGDFIDANKLALAMRNANNEIYAYAELKQEKMATVALATAITDGNAVIGTIGDSRVYVVRNDKVYQITEDQNILEEKVRKGELSKEEAFETEVHKPVVRALGSEKDIVIDIYDGIEVKPGDVLLMCSDGLTAYIGKDEILEAVQADTPKEIVRNLLAYAANQNSPADASAIAIKIYDENTIQTVVRQPGTLPVDTDLNKETKELDLMMKSKPRHQPEKTEKKGTKKTSAYILSALLIFLVIGGIFWFFFDSEGRPSLFGPRMTATATIDPVQATLAIIHQTQQAEAIARLSATPTATLTPFPTMTATITTVPTLFDLNLPVAGAGTETAGIEETQTTLAPVAEEVQATFTPTPIDKGPIVSEKDQAEMVYVKAGEFLLGSDPLKDGYANTIEETPQITVYLDGFWIDKYEVTNARYLKCVQAGGCNQSSYMLLNDPTYADLPVTYVTVEEAEQFCEWAGKRLPTEIEWEKAARGTDGRIYPWGDEEPVAGTRYANYPGYTDPDAQQVSGLFKVGSFPEGASPYGAFDMAGNVWEWTSSKYQADYYQTLVDEAEAGTDVIRNPTGSQNGIANVIRGGSAAETEINNYLAYLRTANRSYVNMTSSYYIGFRCVLPDSEAIDEAGVSVQEGVASQE